MSAALAVLLAVLKILGWLLLILLALVLLLLCIPVMLAAEYRHGQLTASAHYGSVKLALYPQKEKPGRSKKAKRGKKPAAKAPKPEPRKETAPASPPQVTVSAPAPPQEAAPVSPPQEAASAPAPEQPAAPNRRVQALLAALREDPLGMLELALGHVSFAGGALLRGIHVRHLQVFWTVTDARRDAAATAIQYGAQIAVLNNLLARAREHMEIQADFLRLEPDFTGERVDERGLSAEISLRPIVAVLLVPRLAFRLLRDDVLRPILLGKVKPSEQ